MDYFEKYIKYKTKYTKLKYQHGGNKYNVRIKEPWFSLIKNGKKKIEGRLNKGIFSKLKLQDEIIFENDKKLNNMYVCYLHYYKNYYDLLKMEGVEEVLPNIKSIEKGVDLYHKYYKEEDINKYGVVAIGVSENKPKIHDGNLDEIYFNFIKNGKKKYEVRVYDDKRKEMIENDIWQFKNRGNKDDQLLVTLIKKIKIYKSFREAIEDTGISELLPQIDNIEEGIKIYESFDDGNFKINGEKFGVVRFELKVMN